MIGWNESYNWTRGQFEKVIAREFVEKGSERISLDVEHSDRKNMDDIIIWAKEKGYHAFEKNADTIVISKNKINGGI